MKVSKEQIEQWKKQYGNVYRVEVEGKVAYLKSPTRSQISYATVLASTDPVGSNEVLLRECWLGGDMEIQTEDRLFYGVSAQLPSIINTAVAKLEKL